MPKENLLLFDPWKDQKLRASWSWGQCLGLLSLAGAQRLLRVGREHAQHLQEEGHLRPLKLLLLQEGGPKDMIGLSAAGSAAKVGAVAAAGAEQSSELGPVVRGASDPTMDAEVIIHEPSEMPAMEAPGQYLVMSKATGAAAAEGQKTLVPAVVSSDYFYAMRSFRVPAVHFEGTPANSSGACSPRSISSVPDFWGAPLSPRGVTSGGVTGVTSATGAAWPVTATGLSGRRPTARTTLGKSLGLSSPGNSSGDGSSNSSSSNSSGYDSPKHVGGGSTSSSITGGVYGAFAGSHSGGLRERRFEKQNSSRRWGAWAADSQPLI